MFFIISNQGIYKCIQQVNPLGTWGYILLLTQTDRYTDIDQWRLTSTVRVSVSEAGPGMGCASEPYISSVLHNRSHFSRLFIKTVPGQLPFHRDSGVHLALSFKARPPSRHRWRRERRSYTVAFPSFQPGALTS